MGRESCEGRYFCIISGLNVMGSFSHMDWKVTVKMTRLQKRKKQSTELCRGEGICGRTHAGEAYGFQIQIVASPRGLGKIPGEPLPIRVDHTKQGIPTVQQLS